MGISLDELVKKQADQKDAFKEPVAPEVASEETPDPESPPETSTTE